MQPMQEIPPIVTTRIEQVKILPPAGLVLGCSAPAYNGKTNAEFLAAAIEAVASLTACNADNVRAFNSWLDKAE